LVVKLAVAVWLSHPLVIWVVGQVNHHYLVVADQVQVVGHQAQAQQDMALVAVVVDMVAVVNLGLAVPQEAVDLVV
jgi:hypothetical protein